MMQEEPIIQKKTGNVVRVRKPEWLKIRLGDNSTSPIRSIRSSTTGSIPSAIAADAPTKGSAGALAQRPL